MNQTTSLLNAAKATTVILGFFSMAMGVVGGVLYVVELLPSPADAALDNAVVGAAFAVLGIGLGGALAWQGGRSFFGHASARFHLPSVWRLILLYILVVVVGQLIISFDFFSALAFPPFHILAAIIPPLAILTFAGRAFKPIGLYWREIIVQLSSGAFLSTMAAFLVEIIIGSILLLIALLLTALTPDGRAFIEYLSTNLQDPLWLQNSNNIQELLFVPPVFITVALVFIILAPMAEELVKLAGVTLMSYRRPSRVQVFTWGLASGAGFALVENFFNTVLALDVWAFVILLRIGGTAMHCLGTGLMALGWHSLLAERRPWKFLGAYALSVTIHAVWNGVVIGMTGISAFSAGSSSQTTLTLAGGGVIILLISLVALTVAMIAAIVIVTKRLQVDLVTTSQPAT